MHHCPEHPGRCGKCGLCLVTKDESYRRQRQCLAMLDEQWSIWPPRPWTLVASPDDISEAPPDKTSKHAHGESKSLMHPETGIRRNVGQPQTGER